ncbi:ATP-binding protein [Mycolicibacterium celeriflavum]|uniref:ATP-binding protein n=1 Tax=Mycolicibacterium celeriflavum TaxID=1249101 RepID=UPI003CEFC31C
MTERDHRRAVDELLDRAVQAINRGDRATATSLAERVLAVDHGNPDAEDLLAAPTTGGELRRLTLLFCDLVDSTVLSTRIEPEAYRIIVGKYRDQVQRIVDRYEGHIGSTKGDGLLVVFGYPRAHENDVRRAVQAGLDITRDVARLSAQARQRFGVDVSVRVGVHRGLVYLDTSQDDVYGFAANLTARVSSIAPPGTVVVSDAVEPLIRDTFELALRPAQPVKGVEEPVVHHEVIGERTTPARAPLGPLVGRVEELDYLEQSWARAHAGSLDTSGVAFVGEAGIGKSRLAQAAVDLAEESGATVITVFGSPFHTAAGLHPIRDLLERRCGIDRLTDQSDRLRLLEKEITDLGRDPATTLPLLAPVLGIAAEAGYQAAKAEGGKLYEDIVESVHDYLIAALGQGPGLLVIEDLHWFDPSTVEVVDRILSAHLRRVLVVITARDATKLPSADNLKIFDVKALSDNDTDALIAALAPEVSANVRRSVRQRCDGVPLYIEEVITALDRVPLAEHTGHVPDTLYESLLSRLRATRNTVPVVEAAATIGREFDRQLLLSAAELAEDEVDDVLGALEDARVIERIGSDTFRFRHELLREVAYELSPPSVRRTLHGRIAAALDAGSADGKPEWRLVARHYDEAQRFDDAATAYQQAASDARRRGALGESLGFLNEAIARVERMAPGAHRDRREVEIRLRRGFLASAVEGTSSAQAAVDFERCLQVVGTDLTEEFVTTMTALYGYFATRADLQRAEQVLTAVRAGQKRDVAWFLVNNDAGFAMLAWYRGQFSSAREALESIAARTDVGAGEDEAHWFIPNEPLASIYTHLAAARLVMGDFAGAQDEFDRTARRVEHLGFPQGPYSAAYARSYEAWMYIEAGDLDRAAATVAAMAADAERYGFDAFALIAATQQCTVDGLRALTRNPVEPTALERHINTMTMLVEAWRAAEVRMFLTFYDSVVARLLSAAGRADEARARLDAALQLAADTDVHFYDAELLRLRAHTESDADARDRCLRDALALARTQGATIFELRTAADLYRLGGDPARQVLAEAVDRFSPDSTWPELVGARALLA